MSVGLTKYKIFIVRGKTNYTHESYVKNCKLNFETNSKATSISCGKRGIEYFCYILIVCHFECWEHLSWKCTLWFLHNQSHKSSFCCLKIAIFKFQKYFCFTFLTLLLHYSKVYYILSLQHKCSRERFMLGK